MLTRLILERSVRILSTANIVEKSLYYLFFIQLSIHGMSDVKFFAVMNKNKLWTISSRALIIWLIIIKQTLRQN